MRKEILLFVPENQTFHIKSVRLSQITTEWIIIAMEHRIRVTKGADSRADAIRTH